MSRDKPEIVTVARLPISAFWSRPKLKEEVFAPALDEMIVRATNKGGLALRKNVDVSLVGEKADNQPLAQILDLIPLDLTDANIGRILQFPDKPNSEPELDRATAPQRHPSITSLEA